MSSSQPILRLVPRGSLTALVLLLVAGACDRGPAAEIPNQAAKAPNQAAKPVTAAQAQNPHAGAASPHGGSAGPTARPTTAIAHEAAGLGWKPPEAFAALPPANAMRKAQYRIAAAPDAPLLVVHYFGPGQGGGVQQNVDRWIGQIKQPDGSSSEKAAKRVTLKSAGGVTVHMVDVSGTFASTMPGQAAAPAQGSRLLGAIADGPQGPVFFKVVGDASVVGSALENFTALVQSIHPK